jgi:hypothetical protein
MLGGLVGPEPTFGTPDPDAVTAGGVGLAAVARGASGCGFRAARFATFGSAAGGAWTVTGGSMAELGGAVSDAVCADAICAC